MHRFRSAFALTDCDTGLQLRTLESGLPLPLQAEPTEYRVGPVIASAASRAGKPAP